MTEAEQVKAMKQLMDTYQSGERAGRQHAYSHAIGCLQAIQSGDSNTETALLIMQENYERGRGHAK